MDYKLAQLPGYAKLTLTFFLMMLGGGYLAAISLIFFGQGEGKTIPSYQQVRRHYVGVLPSELAVEAAAKAKAAGETKPPPAPRRYTKLEVKISPTESMHKYLGWTNGKEPKKEEAEAKAKLAARNLNIFLAWCDLYRAEWAGKPNPGADGEVEPAAIIAGELDTNTLAADVKKLSFEQFYTRYTEPLLKRHCVTCHGGGNPKGKEDAPLNSLADVRKYIDFEAPPQTLGEDGKAKPAADDGEEKPVGGYDNRKLALHIHIHAVTMGFMALSAAVLMFFTGYSQMVKGLVVPWALAGAMADIGSWIWMKNTNWSVIHPDTIVQYVMMPAGGLFGAMLGLQLTLVFFSMWFGRRT